MRAYGSVRLDGDVRLYGSVRFDGDVRLYGSVRFDGDVRLCGSVRFDATVATKRRQKKRRVEVPHVVALPVPTFPPPHLPVISRLASSSAAYATARRAPLWALRFRAGGASWAAVRRAGRRPR